MKEGKSRLMGERDRVHSWRVVRGASCAGLVALIVLILVGCQAGNTRHVTDEERIRRDTEEARSRQPSPQSSRWIERVTAEPRMFSAGRGDGLDIRFHTDQEGDVRVVIESEAGETVRVLSVGRRGAGRGRIVWDGKVEGGDVAAPGVYRFRVEVEAPSGEIGVFPVDRGNEGEEVLVQALTLDREKSVVRFSLPQASRVRIQTQLEGFPLLETLQDWTPMLAGEHEIPFDAGRVGGAFDLSREARLRVRVDAYALASNALIVVGGEEMALPRMFEIEEQVGHTRYLHATHAPNRCRQPRIEVELLDVEEPDASDGPRVRGRKTVRVTVDDEDQEFLLSGAYELMFFTDLVFLFEEEEGTSPFHYELDTSGLNPGLHFLTVNLITYNDHAAAVSIPFRVEGGAN